MLEMKRRHMELQAAHMELQRLVNEHDAPFVEKLSTYRSTVSTQEQVRPRPGKGTAKHAISTRNR
jgi:hypothetical protein